MANATDVVGYSYEAAVHCVGCARDRFTPAFGVTGGDPGDYTDSEGNEVHPIFNGPDSCEECACCDGTGSHATVCIGGSGTYACDLCGGDGMRSIQCDDCGEELVS